MINEFFGRAGWCLDLSASQKEFLATATEVKVWDDTSGALTIALLVDGPSNGYRMRFSDQLAVDVFPTERLVLEAEAFSRISEGARNHILADQVLPRLISHDGSLVLHAGAVQRNSRCIIFVGESGSGKSSLSASFDRDGYQLMGDDALIILQAAGTWRAVAVYPSLRLFPDSVSALLRSTATTHSVANYTSKLRVDVTLSPDTERARPSAIDAIFVLAGPVRSDAIIVRRISRAASCMALIRNSFALDPTDTHSARKRLEHASRVSATVPAYEISYPHDYAQLPRVREAILAAVERGS